MLSSRYQHWLYVWIPLVTAFMWSGTLLSMLITWLAMGRQRYVTMEGSIAYISDIGAGLLKPLFIVGCSFTGVGFVLCLIAERLLRHQGRLLPNMRTRERVYAILAIVGSFIGGCGLILLSIFDTKRYTTLHRLFLLVFIVGVGLSAIFTVVEYRWLSKNYTYAARLRAMYITKAVIASVLIVLAAGFAAAMFTNPDAAAVLEWVIAFGFTLYLLTFYFDLRESKGRQKGELSRDAVMASGRGIRRPMISV